MRLFPFLPLIVLAVATASAASVAFSIPPGECKVYFVSGSLMDPPTIEVDQGDAEIRSMIFLPPNTWRIEICCAETSPQTCEGWIRP